MSEAAGTQQGRRRALPTRTGCVAGLAIALASVAAPAGGQLADSVRVTPGPEYERSGLTQRLLGRGYRPLWTAPVRVEVLDLASFAGGLTPLEPGGGHQTRTLHMRGADGKRYIFRSVDKFVGRALPEDLQRTPVQDLFQDHTSALHPTGALSLPPLLEAAGVLHVEPRLVVMPDDARLGEHREEFAGMLGQIEERPDEGEGGAPGFSRSRRVVGMERLLERIQEDPAQVVAAEEYLAARLIDLLVGDTDRGSDQWRWAGEERAGGGLRFRPVPRDRDWAFIRSDGWLSPLARTVFPKLVDYGPAYPSMRALTFSSVHLDRRLLPGLPRETWDSVAVALQAALTDAVLARAVAALPPEHVHAEGPRMAAALASRRDALPEAARAFYHLLAGQVDVFGTEESDSALVEVHPDGSIEVRLNGPGDAAVAGRKADERAEPGPRPAAPAATSRFQRRFRPAETREVRIYLLEGADHAVVRGAGPSRITVRIIGGVGDDVLVDSAGADAAEIAFYDARGTNEIRPGPGTKVDREVFEPPGSGDGWFEQKVARTSFQDWGGGRGVGPTFGYGEGAGLIVGARLASTRHGFRRVPWAHQLWLEGRYALGSGGFGVEAGGARTFESSPWSVSLVGLAEQFDALRFYGFGNDAPLPAGDEHGPALVMQDRVALSAALAAEPGPGRRLSLGIRARWLDPRPVVGSPLALSQAFGATAHGTAGLWAEGELSTLRSAPPRGTGYALQAAAALHPGVWDAPGGFGALEGEARGHVSYGPTLALRAGGRKAWGRFPVQEAAFVGGKATLRGYRYQRFAGDGAVYGSAELRSRIARALLVVRGDLGAFVFTDVARVYVGRASPGGWHTGYGAGLSFTSLGRTLSGSWALGEEHRIYLDLGLPF